MNKYHALPIVVEAERWDGDKIYGGRIQEVWFMYRGVNIPEYKQGAVIRGLLSRPFKDGEKQVITAGDWIIRYEDGTLTSMDDLEFTSKFTSLQNEKDSG